MSRSKRDTDFRTKGSSKRDLSLVSNILYVKVASLFLNLATYVIPVFNTKKHNFVGNLTVCSSSVADPITDPGSNIKEEGKNRLGALSFLIFFIFLPCYKIVNYEKNFTPSEKDLSQLTMN